jgi:hypothetical protein
MKYTKTWNRVGPLAFTANGTSGGKATVSTTFGFFKNQQVKVTATGLPDKNLEVKRVLSRTELLLGPQDGSDSNFSALNLYTTALSASIEAPEQSYGITPDEAYILASSFESQPASALRNLLVDPWGDPYTDANPLPVNASVSIGDVTIAINAFGLTPDSALAVGSEDGTASGTRHVLKTTNDGTLLTSQAAATVSCTDFARIDISGTNITTGAYVQLIAATSGAAKKIEIQHQCGSSLYLAFGGAGSEVDKLIIPPGGNGLISLNIPASTRLSVKAIATNATSGELMVNLFDN